MIITTNLDTPRSTPLFALCHFPASGPCIRLVASLHNPQILLRKVPLEIMEGEVQGLPFLRGARNVELREFFELLFSRLCLPTNFWTQKNWTKDIKKRVGEKTPEDEKIWTLIQSSIKLIRILNIYFGYWSIYFEYLNIRTEFSNINPLFPYKSFC